MKKQQRTQVKAKLSLELTLINEEIKQIANTLTLARIEGRVTAKAFNNFMVFAARMHTAAKNFDNVVGNGSKGIETGLLNFTSATIILYKETVTSYKNLAEIVENIRT